MFNISYYSFDFTDVTISCVGLTDNINMLCQFYNIHAEALNPDAFLDRIIAQNIYCCFEGKSMASSIKIKKYNKVLKNHNLLFDTEFFPEIMLLSNPHKMISTLSLEDLYGQELEISSYLNELFPHLPEKFTINRA